MIKTAAVREFARSRRVAGRVAAAMGVVCIVCVGAVSSCRHAALRVEEVLGRETARTARLVLYPDYAGLVIPPNIAPLNFQVRKTATEALSDVTRFCVRISSETGTPIHLMRRSPSIRIPKRPWRRLLMANRGKELSIEIAVQRKGEWQAAPTIRNRIAKEETDPYLVYRQLRPNFNWWRNVGVYQRSLEGFDESVLLHGRTFGDGCVNCHTFRNNDPERMLLGIRGLRHGSSTLYAHDGRVEKVGARWGYSAWHPDGEIVAYAVMKVRQFFHRAGMEMREVVDLDAAILYCELESGKVKANPALADNERLETYPAWTPDGKYLYFCSSPIPWSDRDRIPPRGYETVRYDLRRVSYDAENDRWGAPETVLAAAETGKSILQPRFSPNGRFLLFCMCDYGCFPAFRETSDLYLMDMRSGEYRRLDVNSRYSESWHSWSSNGRWIVFSSKRRGGLFTRPYLSHVDAEGRAGKPFILPQADPTFYDSHLETINVPEFVTGPVPYRQRTLTSAVRSLRARTVNDALTRATPDAVDGELVEAWEQVAGLSARGP